MTATIALKNAESALVTTRTRILRQIARANEGTSFANTCIAQTFRCVLLVLDSSLEAPSRARVFAESSALYRAPRKLELARAKARANRVADRCAA